MRHFDIFAADSGPPLTTRDGFAAVGLPNIKQIDVSKNWKRFDNVMQYRLDSSGWGPAGAKADAIGMIDLGDIEPLAAIYLAFGGPDAAWQHGGKVELSADGKAWSTVFDSPARLGDSKIPLPAITDARYIRITDKFDGTIGTARLGAVLPMLVSGAPPPVPLSSFSVPGLSGRLSAAVYPSDCPLASPSTRWRRRNERSSKSICIGTAETCAVNRCPPARPTKSEPSPIGLPARFDGVVGNTAPLPFNKVSAPPVYTTGLATDPDGNLYTSSPGDEDGQNCAK